MPGSGAAGFPKGRSRPPVALFLSAFLLFMSVGTSGASAQPPSAPAAGSVGEYLEARGIPRYGSTVPKLYFSPEEWNERALRMVEEADDYILISSFLVNLHSVNAGIMDALARKAEEGVRVYIMYDSSSYYTYMPDGISYLPTAREAFRGTKVHVAEYNPISGERIFDMIRLLDRDHRKFWIVDGKYLAAGGINLNYFSCAPLGLYGNIDTFAEIEGRDAVAAMVKSFCVTWNAYSVEGISPGDFRVRESDGETSVWLVDQGMDYGAETDILFDAFFETAKKDLWLVQAYTFVTPALLRKVRKATERGVAVSFVFSTNSLRVEYEKAAKYGAKDLLEAGARIYIFDAPSKSFLHYKLILADGRAAAFGSPNFNFRSVRLSREIALVFDEEETGRQTLENLHGLLAHARPLEMEEARGYRGLEYLMSYVAMLFGG